MANWHSRAKGKGTRRVILDLKQPGGDFTAATVKSLQARAQREALGLPIRRESPVSGLVRPSRYARRGYKKPKHPRVRLRETVAREARDIQDMARRHATAAMERMAHIVNNPHSPENAQIAAAAVILDRAYGRPNQTNTNVNVDANGKPKEVSGSELDRRIEEALRAVETLTGRARKEAKGQEQPADLRERNRNPDGSGSQLH